MRSRLRLAGALVSTVLGLAACGGSHTASLPAADRSLRPQLNGGSGSLAQPTLYVAGQGGVFAYDLSASGDTPPVSKSNGYYYNALSAGAAIAGIATNSTADVVIVQNLRSTTGPGCQIVLIPARTPANVNSSFQWAPCHVPDHDGDGSNSVGRAVGVTFTGPATTFASNGFPDDIDVLMQYLPQPYLTSLEQCDGSPPPASPWYQIDRYQVQNDGSVTAEPCITLSQGTTSGVTYQAIAGSTNGALFADYTPTSGNTIIERYDALGSLSNFAQLPGTGALAVAANPTTNVGYRIVASTVGGATTIYSFVMAAGSSMTFNHALGTFTNPVAALAVDNNGKIYVGINQPNGVTKVKVYSASKTEATNPDYILNNPVRRPNPAASPVAVITGMAIAQ